MEVKFEREKDMAGSEGTDDGQQHDEAKSHTLICQGVKVTAVPLYLPSSFTLRYNGL